MSSIYKDTRTTVHVKLTNYFISYTLQVPDGLQNCLNSLLNRCWKPSLGILVIRCKHRAVVLHLSGAHL